MENAHPKRGLLTRQFFFLGLTLTWVFLKTHKCPPPPPKVTSIQGPHYGQYLLNTYDALQSIHVQLHVDPLLL